MAQVSGALSAEKSVPLPGVSGRIDHFSVDVPGERLFVAAVENHSVEIVDLKSGRRVHSIEGLSEPQGILYDARTHHLFVASAHDGIVKMFDGDTFEILATIKFPDDADNIRYDGSSKEVIVGYAGAKKLRKRQEGSGGLGFLTPDGTKIADIVIDAHPESFQLEREGSRLFVNVPEKKEIEVVDRAKRSILARWPVVAAENNFPMALDETHHRLFAGCWTPPRLLAFDTDTGKQVASAEITGKTDDLFYDPATSRIYVLTSPGSLDVIQQKDADHYIRLASYPTPRGTQTGLLVPEWGKLFAAVPRQNGNDAEIRVYSVH